MSYRSWDEWKARGRFIIKGEKSMGRLNDGTPLFGKEQTKKIPKRNWNSFEDDALWDEEEIGWDCIPNH